MAMACVEGGGPGGAPLTTTVGLAMAKLIGMVTRAPPAASPSTACGIMWNRGAMARAAAPKPMSGGVSLTTWQSCTSPLSLTRQVITARPLTPRKLARSG